MERVLDFICDFNNDLIRDFIAFRRELLQESVPPRRLDLCLSFLNFYLGVIATGNLYLHVIFF